MAAGTLWTIGVTAGSPSAAAAADAVCSALPLKVLRWELGDLQSGDDLSVATVMTLGESPLLLSARTAVAELNEATVPPPEAEEERVTIPVEETSLELPATADNGVPARTLIPTDPSGYTIWGRTYISNSTDYTISAEALEHPFAAQLTGEAPQVLILHTHGSEAYTMPPGKEYTPSGEWRTTDETVSVVRVGEEIACTLRNAGISVLHVTTLHDYPEYSGAYERSLLTVEDCLKRYPSISLVLDVHRDAVTDGDGNHYKVVSGEGGMGAAQMAFVIGTDGGGLAHPRWQENLKLAAAIQQELYEICPTLMRPITVRNSRYNQHTTTGSLLVEMGAAGNSLEEALLSARMLGRAIADTMLPETERDIPA